MRSVEESWCARSGRERRGCGCCRSAGARSRCSEVDGAGVFEAFLPRRKPPLEYRLEATWLDGSTFAYDDPYAFPPTLGDVDLYLIGEGRHEELYDVLGAHERELEGAQGHVVRGLGARGPLGQRRRRLQQLGRPRPPAEIARVERGLGALRPGDRDGQPLQVRDPPRERATAPEGRSPRLGRRAAACQRLRRVPVAVRVERRRVARDGASAPRPGRARCRSTRCTCRRGA